jgi:hypothetical protein
MNELHEFISWKNFKKDFQEYLNNKSNGSCKSTGAYKITYKFIRFFFTKRFFI